MSKISYITPKAHRHTIFYGFNRMKPRIAILNDNIKRLKPKIIAGKASRGDMRIFVMLAKELTETGELRLV